jgi:hypothetical protein
MMDKEALFGFLNPEKRLQRRFEGFKSSYDSALSRIHEAQTAIERNNALMSQLSKGSTSSAAMESLTAQNKALQAQTENVVKSLNQHITGMESLATKVVKRGGNVAEAFTPVNEARGMVNKLLGVNAQAPSLWSKLKWPIAITAGLGGGLFVASKIMKAKKEQQEAGIDPMTGQPV